MALNDIVPVQTSSKKGGGGLWGTIIGTVAPLVAGAIAAPFVGPGAAAVPALMGAGVGGTAGGVVGNMIDPAEASQSQSSDLRQSSVDKKASMMAMQSDPNVQLASMASAKDLLKSADMPNDQALQYQGLLTDAMGKLKNRMGNG